MNIKGLINKIAVLMLVLIMGFAFGCTQDEPEKKPTEINTELTDALKLTTDYTNKSFIDDGIGLVKLYQNVDGDTAHFRDIEKNFSFTARFLMINTPESTGKIDPWGKTASKFVGNILSNAFQIICEAEGKKAEKDTTNKRYLAYVWYRNSENEDFRLLNLEVVEECYSRTNSSTSKYLSTFQEAENKGQLLLKRVYGEKDPNYDYSLTVNEITIAYLREHFDTLSGGSILKITARIIRKVGDNMYLEDVDQTWNEETQEYATAGIYMYSGYGSGLGGYPIGCVIELICKCVDNDTYGKQLTEPRKIEYISYTKDVILREYSGTEQIDLQSLEGLVISIDKVKVTGVSAVKEGSFTIYCVSDTGQNINVRIDDSASPKIDSASVQVGSYYSVIGGVSKFSDTYQIMLGNNAKEGENDFVLYVK